MSTDKKIDSKSKIADALANLLKEKTMEEISISEVIALAGVGKSTFYRHYHDIYEVFENLTDGFANRAVGIMIQLVFSGEHKDYGKCKQIIDFSEAMTMFGLKASDKILVDYLFRTQNMTTFHLVVERFREVVRKYAQKLGMDEFQADFYTRFVMNGVLYSSLSIYRENGTFNMELVKLLKKFDIGKELPRGENK